MSAASRKLNPSSPRSPRNRSPWLGRGIVVVAVAAALAVGGYLLQQRNAEASAGGWRTAQVERGDIRVGISATGSLAAISTVEVGSQISGQITEVLVDYNDPVAKDQVIARIDPSTYEAQIAQGDASVASARAGLATAEATLRNAEADYTRKMALADTQLVARSDADLARAARDQARAQVAAARAQIEQQIASTRTSRLNLDRTVIRSPVDGVVLTRSIEPGQTVAASLQAPILFEIAEDLSKMEIVLAIDEADIGQVKAGQGVAFTVDAFPDRQFRGTVQQVRLSATNISNVITYPVVVAVDNREQLLLPGMTANAEIEVNNRDDVLRVPNAALRYRPDEDVAPVAPSGRGGMQDDLPRIAAMLDLDDAQQAAFDSAIEQMRERMAARIAAARAGGTRAGNGGGNALFGRGPGGNGAATGRAGMSGEQRQRMMERFNQQFAGFTALLDEQQQAAWNRELADLLGARMAPLYRLKDGKLQAVMVRVGASDGSWSEVSGDIADGDTLVTGRERSSR